MRTADKSLKDIRAFNVLIAIFAAAAAWLAFAGPGEAQETTFRIGARADVVVDGQEDVVAIGARVSVLGDARGDIWVLGGEVEVDVATGGNLSAIGGSVDMRGSIAEDAWISGGNVDISGAVGKDLRVVGANILVTEGARMGGGSSVIGASVDFRGTAEGPLTVTGEEIAFSGKTAGRLVLQGRTVRILDGAQIDGDVVVRTEGKPQIAEGAKISGKVTVEAPPPQGVPARDWNFSWMVVLAFAASAFVVGASVMLLMPNIMSAATATVQNRSGLALINGLLAAIGGPIVAVGLVLVLVTLPLGAFLFLAFPLLALLGHSVIGNAIGQKLVAAVLPEANMFMRLVALAIGVGIVAALGLLPYIGIVLVILLLVVGVGASLLAFAAQLFGSAEKRAT